MGNARTYYKEYVDTRQGFDNFHNEVINVPRPSFDGIGLEILQQVASYLLLIEGKTSISGNNYKEIMTLIHNEILKGHYPEIRNIPFEKEYFVFGNIEEQYDKKGRMFRHYMELVDFWGMIRSLSKAKKNIDFERCKDFVSLKAEQLDIFNRNLGLNLDIKTNDFINNLEGIYPIKADANYHPTLTILKYMKEIGRGVTDFELSILLGRIDKLQDEVIILKRALEIGRQFQSKKRKGQQEEFFKLMGWHDKTTNILYTYGSSQQPWFKFRSYILFLQDFGFIEYNPISENYSLTEDSLEILGDLPAPILELNKLISKLNLDSAGNSDSTMKDIIIKTNMDILTSLIKDSALLKKINLYSLSNPNIGKDGRKQRNQFIAELARIRENYMCQAGTTTFERPDGRNYVEAHHIIEFAKGGPDILENLLVLGPTPHMQIHRGSDKARCDMYTHLMSKGAITFNLFKKMVEEYHCLTVDHLEFLVINKLISTKQKDELQHLMQ